MQHERSSLDEQRIDCMRIRCLRVRRIVRRAKARSFSGCESRPATGAPAGSNRSSRGGNKTAEAFGVEGHVSDLTSMQAVT